MAAQRQAGPRSMFQPQPAQPRSAFQVRSSFQQQSTVRTTIQPSQPPAQPPQPVAQAPQPVTQAPQPVAQPTQPAAQPPQPLAQPPRPQAQQPPQLQASVQPRPSVPPAQAAPPPQATPPRPSGPAPAVAPAPQAAQPTPVQAAPLPQTAPILVPLQPPVYPQQAPLLVPLQLPFEPQQATMMIEGSSLACAGCHNPLTGKRYILREERPFCIPCYESSYANKCEECHQPIGTDFKDLSYKDKHWHEACFKCTQCNQSLVDKPFACKNDRTYCSDCHDNLFALRCDACQSIFRAGMKKYEFKGKQFHEQCFSCKVCRQPIGTKTFIPRETEAVCIPCYEEQYAQRCVKCNGVINKGGITYKEAPWHRECFTCAGCNRQLTGEKFTSREDKPYCADCFAVMFAKKCCRCTQPITGLGSTKFISFDDKHWHNDCFVCYKCTCSLVGRGFLVTANDVLCPDCGRA